MNNEKDIQAFFRKEVVGNYEQQFGIKMLESDTNKKFTSSLLILVKKYSFTELSYSSYERENQGM